VSTSEKGHFPKSRVKSDRCQLRKCKLRLNSPPNPNLCSFSISNRSRSGAWPNGSRLTLELEAFSQGSGRTYHRPSDPGLDRALFHKLATCQWLRDHQHLVIVGPTGVGKSWLACALGHKACRDGFSVLYNRAARLLADLAQARGEGRLPRMLGTLERTRLLIIDDWGPEPLTAEQRRDLLEIVDDRYDKGSLLITSQLPVDRWHDVIGDPTFGDAILDRVIHKAHRINLKGDSLRRRQAMTA
jgi:DNA replication protein DnaC